MTAGVRAFALLALLVAIAVGCGPTPRPQEPQATPRDLVVLAPNPETGDVGELVVTTAGGSVNLTRARESTVVSRGGAPGAVVVLSEEEVQRVFGAALAVQPAAAQHFNLYFELGGDQLTPASQAMVADVTALVRGRTAIDVTVIGHTDTTGDRPSNAALGLRRATLIRDLLIQAGLDGTVVEVRSHGESDPVVLTPDNTAEARNRRVEVTIR
jgi:outer membrane protein OmpA-like peptidoglycan-associated protein